MKGVSVGRILELTLLGCVMAGCGPGERGPQPVPPGAGGHLALHIAQVQEKQQLLDRPPWHVPGGDWTFLDCQLQNAPTIQVLVGIKINPADSGDKRMGQGEAVLLVKDATSGAQFVKAFAKAFRQSPPPSSQETTPGRLHGAIALLGSNMTRGPQGGFQPDPGSWTVTKWFLEDDTGASEIYFNYSIAEKRAEFTEKDEEYRAALVEQVGMALRNGPPPMEELIKE